MRQFVITALERLLSIAVALATLSVLGLAGYLGLNANGDTKTLLIAVAVLFVGMLAVVVLGGCGFLAVSNARTMRRLATFIESNGRTAKPLTATRGRDDARPAPHRIVAAPEAEPVKEPVPVAAAEPDRREPSFGRSRAVPTFSPKPAPVIEDPVEESFDDAITVEDDAPEEPIGPPAAPERKAIFSRGMPKPAPQKSERPSFLNAPRPLAAAPRADHDSARKEPSPQREAAPAKSSGRLVADRRPPR